MRCTDPDPNQSALLTIDVQNDFTALGAPAEVEGTRQALPAMRRLVEAFRANKRPIFHVVRLYHPDGSNAELCRRERIAAGTPIVAPGSEGAELVEELKPFPDMRLDAPHLIAGELQQLRGAEWLIYKPRWGAFFGTRLEEILRQYRVDSVVVCGCNYPNCPRATIYEASERDFKVALVTDAISGLYERGCKELLGIGVSLFTSAECADWFAKRSGS